MIQTGIFLNSKHEAAHKPTSSRLWKTTFSRRDLI
jgi:hypothetical protein